MEATLRGLIEETSAGLPDATTRLESGTIIPSRTNSPDRAIEGTHQEPMVRVSDSMMSDDGWSPIVHSVPSAEASMQPLDYGQRLAQAARPREEPLASESDVPGSTAVEDGIPTVGSSSVQEEADNDNAWVKIGSGIAVLGAAAIGGAFLAMQHNDRNNSNNNGHGSQQNTSSVTIERLDDDEDDGDRNGEWEATCSTASSRCPQ